MCDCDRSRWQTCVQSIIALRKIKRRLHIVQRWRQLETKHEEDTLIQLRDLRFLASHERMQCSCDMHNTSFDPDMTNEVGASWQTDQRNSNEEIAEEHFWELLRGIVVEIDASMRTNMWIWP